LQHVRPQPVAPERLRRSQRAIAGTPAREQHAAAGCRERARGGRCSIRDPAGRRLPRRCRHRRYQAVQPLITALHAGQQMQNPLVDAQRRARQCVARQHFDKPPAAQRPVARQRAPMRVRQCGEREAESRVALARIALCTGTGLSEAAVQFYPRTKQQHRDLERTQGEDLGEPIDRRRRVERRRELRSGIG